jgi:CHAT domain-containing protein
MLNILCASEVLIPWYTVQNQSDQAIHLAATMLFAGFKSVIATMWLVVDLSQ